MLERWLAKNCLTLGELDRERIAEIDRKLALKLDGSQMSANAANRIRIVARACIHSAIVTQQPASKTYRVMTAVAYYGGLRP